MNEAAAWAKIAADFEAYGNGGPKTALNEYGLCYAISDLSEEVRNETKEAMRKRMHFHKPSCGDAFYYDQSTGHYAESWWWRAGNIGDAFERAIFAQLMAEEAHDGIPYWND